MYKNILVPISFDQARDAAGAIEAAQALLTEGGHITLIHVIEHIPDYAASYLPSNFMTEKRKHIEDDLDKVVKAVPGASGVVVTGHAGRTILDWAEKQKSDCIVIASHRPGMQDLLLGSTAAKVVRHAACAVHVLR